VLLRACLFVCPSSRISGITLLKFTNFVAVAGSSGGVAIRHVLPVSCLHAVACRNYATERPILYVTRQVRQRDLILWRSPLPMIASFKTPCESDKFVQGNDIIFNIGL